MNRRGLLVLWVLLSALAFTIPGVLPAPARADLPEESPRTLTYEIDVALDPEARELTAKGTLTWRNDSPVSVPDVHLHMYLNAFKNRFTTFMRESEGSHRGNKFAEAHPGGVEITAFRLEDGTDLAGSLEYIQPDLEITPLAKDDETVARIPLPDGQAIAPGASATFEIEWVSKLPRVFARTGHGGEFFMVAQWFPKPGVWEPQPAADGEEPAWGWTCHQFHGSSEFYADYGVYRVRMTVPEGFALGASGERQGEPTTANGQVTYEHLAEDVHDFAWVASPDFVVYVEEFEGGSGTSAEEHGYVASVLGRDKDEIALDPVTVTFLLQPEHADQLERHKQAVFNALTYLGFWFGKYPYPTLTVVDPDHRGRDAGGMEYPTLITGWSRIIRPERQLSPEGVLVHEFAHQHFYGLVGTNEFTSAWMDEGMTTYATAKALMRAYPPPKPITWYDKIPIYGERPVEFEGIAAESRKAMPMIAKLFDDHLKMPFGEFGPIRRVHEQLGINDPPDEISLWLEFGEVGPLSILREMPPLSLLELRPSSVGERERGSVASRDIVDPIAGRKAWEYMNRRSYGANSYSRPSSALRTLEGYIGEEAMIKVMRTYAERYRFKHPTPEDFYATAVEVAKEDGHGDIRWLFRELFESATDFDFGIESITSQDAPKPEHHDGEWYESIVTVRRYGGAKMPVGIQVAFGDDDIRKFRWELDDTVTAEVGEAPQVLTPARGEQSRWVKLYFQGEEKVTVAEVDPQGLLGLDKDRTNDGKRADAGMPSAYVALKALAWVQMTTTFYGGL